MHGQVIEFGGPRRAAHIVEFCNRDFGVFTRKAANESLADALRATRGGTRPARQSEADFGYFTMFYRSGAYGTCVSSYEFNSILLDGFGCRAGLVKRRSDAETAGARGQVGAHIA